MTNQGELIVEGELNASGQLNNADGTINNLPAGTIRFSEPAMLTGNLINNGQVQVSDSELLTLTGSISCSGLFAGDTMLDGAKVNLGNSPGVLTFVGNTIWDEVSLTIEIAQNGAGFEFDQISILGDLTLNSAFSLDFDLLYGLELDDIAGQVFEFMQISGNVFDENGLILDLDHWAMDLAEGWGFSWTTGEFGGWSLDLRYLLDDGNTATDVSAPSSVLLALLSCGLILYRRPRNIRH